MFPSAQLRSYATSSFASHSIQVVFTEGGPHASVSYVLSFHSICDRLFYKYGYLSLPCK